MIYPQEVVNIYVTFLLHERAGMVNFALGNVKTSDGYTIYLR